MSIIFLPIALLMILGFAAYLFKGDIRPNEKKSMAFKFWIFSFTINQEHHKDQNHDSTGN